MVSGPSQFETWPGDRRRIGRNRPKTVNVMGSNEGRDLLAWPLVIPKLNGVECKLALIANQNGPVHLSASNACANPMRRAFNGLENTASALDCPHPTSQPTAAPPDRSRARSDGASAPLEPASVPSGEKAPRGRCQSPRRLQGTGLFAWRSRRITLLQICVAADHHPMSIRDGPASVQRQSRRG